MLKKALVSREAELKEAARKRELDRWLAGAFTGELPRERGCELADDGSGELAGELAGELTCELLRAQFDELACEIARERRADARAGELEGELRCEPVGDTAALLSAVPESD